MKSKIQALLKAKREWLFPLILLFSATATVTAILVFSPSPQKEPASTVSVTAQPTESAAETEPVTETAPVTEVQIEYFSHMAYINGHESFFSPDRMLTRGEAAILVYRLFGESEDAPSAFIDVAEDGGFYQEISGAGAWFPTFRANQFQPDEPILREDLFDAVFHASQYRTFTPEELEVAGETPYTAFARRLGLMDDDETSEYVTRGEATHIFNRVAGRTPDEGLLLQSAPVVFADVSPVCPYYADIMEAAVSHAYYIDEEQEVWGDAAFTQLKKGFYRKDGIAYYVQENGTLLTTPGLQDIPSGTVFVSNESGLIFADDRLHLSPDGVVFCRKSGTILKGGSRNGCTFDENGIYTSGNDELDAYVNAVYEACLTEDMSQLEKLRACYDYVRSFNYLGRNKPLDDSVKTMDVDLASGYALKLFETGKGDCYNFTAAFLFLARGLGYDAEAVVGYCSYFWSQNAIPHGWVTITADDGNVYLCDPQLENYNIRAGISNEDFGAFMTTFDLSHAYYYPN